jgi:hypothetical protein
MVRTCQNKHTSANQQLVCTPCISLSLCLFLYVASTTDAAHELFLHVLSLLAHKKYGCCVSLSLSMIKLARERNRRLKKKIPAAAGRRQPEEEREEE